MKFAISHRTHYRYSQAVAQSQHILHLAPRALPHQRIHAHGLEIAPAPAMRYDGLDAFSNPISILDVELPHREFVILARSTVETLSRGDIAAARTTAWDRLDDMLHAPGIALDLDVIQFRVSSGLTQASRELVDYGARSFPAGRPVLDGVLDLTHRIFCDFMFDPTATNVATPLDKVMSQRRGVCQDFAHLALACLRALRIPARYVSGYILTRPPPGLPKRQGADASHAWISVWAPEIGWCDFDPTNGLMTKEEHIAIALGRDYNDVSPVSGVLLGGGRHTIAIEVDVSTVG